MINTMTIQGRLTADPELRYTPGGKAVVKFSIANDLGYGDKKKTVFPTFVAWEAKANYIANYARKGAVVIVQATYSENSFTGDDGKKRKSVENIVNEIFIPYDNKNASEGYGNGDSFTPKGLDDESYRALEDDEVPF